MAKASCNAKPFLIFNGQNFISKKYLNQSIKHYKHPDKIYAVFGKAQSSRFSVFPPAKRGGMQSAFCV